MTYSIQQRIWRFSRTAKGSLLVVFLGLLSVMGSVTGWQMVLPHIVAAVVGACGVELGATWRRKRWPSSAFLSGMIVAFVLGPETVWWVTLGVGGLATGSK